MKKILICFIALLFMVRLYYPQGNWVNYIDYKCKNIGFKLSALMMVLEDGDVVYINGTYVITEIRE